jgi:hypothetical protein
MKKLIDPYSLFLKSKRRKELNGTVVGRGVLLYYNKRLSLIQIGSDDVIKTFGINKSGVFRRGI